MKKKVDKVVEPEYPKVVETFRSIGSWEMNRLKESEPSSFNGFVNVEKYRITVEKIEEPIEVITERLEKLWAESDNWHERPPLVAAAKRFNYTYKSTFGERRPPRK